jgi:DNA repair protein RecO (recombination protein O)
MGLEKTTAVVIGTFPLGESDRVVTFFSRDFGKVRGVARAARRMRSRFTGALELFTAGHLVFFDSGRSDLVTVDHFDIVHPFDGVRDRLERLGQAAWVVECVGRLTAERDPNAAVYGLLLRALRSVEAGTRPDRVAVVFGLRCVDALGHRLRIDVCIACGRRGLLDRAPLALDVDAGGVRCAACAAVADALLPVAPATLGVLRQLRGMAWDEAISAPLGRAERELRDILDVQVSHLAGHPVRASRFIREVARLSTDPGGPR